jgi:hypothetical protein
MSAPLFHMPIVPFGEHSETAKQCRQAFALAWFFSPVPSAVFCHISAQALLQLPNSARFAPEVSIEH